MTWEVFRRYITRLLGSILKSGNTVVMDNVLLHRTREALEQLGFAVSELSVYSQRFNPIEPPIGKLKSFQCKLGPRLLRSLMAGVRNGLKQFSPAECAAYLRHAGYGQPARNRLVALRGPHLIG
jgi:hypothetical protein